jgi:hypothetical protein
MGEEDFQLFKLISVTVNAGESRYQWLWIAIHLYIANYGCVTLASVTCAAMHEDVIMPSD